MGEQRGYEAGQLAMELDYPAANRRPPEVFLAFGHEMIRRLATSSQPVNSSAGIEMAFGSVLDDYQDGLPPESRGQLAGYLFGDMPHQVEGFLPDSDPYLLAAADHLGSDDFFNYVVLPASDLEWTAQVIIEESRHQQLSFDDEPPADTL